ncbi:hypothetical protein D3C87_1459660 [compost metagenome]
MFFAHQHVNATVVIAGLVEGGDAILPGPVGFEISERLIIETTDQRQRMRVGFEFTQVLAMLFEAALLLPETGDTRAVLPAVEARQVLLDVQRAQGNPGTQPRIEASIHFTPGFDRPPWMALAVGHDHLLRIAAGQ